MLALWFPAHALMIDLQVYREGGAAVLAGRPLYEGGILLDLPFVYPPVAAALFVPLTLLPLPLLKVLWTALGVLLLVLVIRRAARLTGLPAPVGVVTLLVAAALWLDPVRTTFYLGQINVLLLALVFLDLTGRSRFRGLGVGIAAALKLTPLLFVVYLLLTGRRREAATAVAAFVAATGIGFLVAPADSVQYWLRGTFAAANRISDVGGDSNHSVHGLVVRLGGGPVGYLVVGLLLGAAALWVARGLHRRGAEVEALSLVGLASAAVAPFAWSHHYVWFVPLLVALVARGLAEYRGPAEKNGARRAWLATGLVLAATAAVITRLPGPGVGPIPATGLISLWPDAYVAAFVISCAALLPAARSGSARTAPTGSPPR
ncbi:glycosyltransferase 87 family protein [Pseudonocardia ailaonensis]|uniref:Glycosyltransferase 87 family protein n=1 Tax=Pseudonocardia ailaonensis TaxID=367279 RepID=A0ABN2N6W9_9PSEU